jgi:hypothetical protein
MEGGLFEKIWADAHLRARLESMGSSDFIQNDTSSFFVFEIHHLSAAFMVLILGHILSCIVFVLRSLIKSFLRTIVSYMAFVNDIPTFSVLYQIARTATLLD